MARLCVCIGSGRRLTTAFGGRRPRWRTIRHAPGHRDRRRAAYRPPLTDDDPAELRDGQERANAAPGDAGNPVAEINAQHVGDLRVGAANPAHQRRDHLTRMELQVALYEFHCCIPDYEIKPSTKLTHTATPRSVESLPLVAHRRSGCIRGLSISEITGMAFGAWLNSSPGETCAGERAMHRRCPRAGNGSCSAGSGTRLTARSRLCRPAF